MKVLYNKNKLIKNIHMNDNVGLVPTMGAIHFGHISLIKKSIEQCDKTIVTIFVNKPQFNKKSDFNKYPRNLKKDVNNLKKLKIDFLYLPSQKEIYPNGINRNIKICSFKNQLCGKNRPNHFESVADVIDRFIKIIKPKKIYFGKKDFQQLKILEDFIKKNHSKVNVVGCKTIREKNGIAYSSRNLLLTINEKKIASQIYVLLKKNKKKIVTNNSIFNKIKKNIYELGIRKIDYFKILDTNKILKPYKKKKNFRIFIAYYLKTTRLIDNI